MAERIVPYRVQTIDHPNPIARYAHQARYRTSLDLISELLPANGVILDFGAGEGELLRRVSALRPDVRLIAFEPYMTVTGPNIELCTAWDQVQDRSVDLLCAFETLEHVDDNLVALFLLEANRVCRAGAAMVISVPIMQGMALPLKEASRSFLFRRSSDHSLVELAVALFGGRVPRAKNVLLSHKGFDHRVLKKLLLSKFNMTATRHSPFARLPWWCNSQVFYILKV